MATINLTAGTNDVVPGNPAEADIVIVPAGSQITENDFVFNFQTPDRLDLRAFATLDSIDDLTIQPLQGGAVRVSNPLFGQITLIGITQAQLTANNFIFAGATGQADLTITKTDSPDPVSQGGTLTYTLVVSNTGAAGASGIVVQDTLPTGFTVTSATASGNGFATTAPATGTLSFSGGTLAAGASATLTIVGTAPATAGSITNTAVVDPNNAIPESNETNNTATVTTTVTTVSTPPTGIFVDDNLAGTAPGTTVTVDPDDTGPQAPVAGLIFGQTAFARIQAAIDATPAGGTVRVAPGTYNEFVNFVKPFTLLGPNVGIDPITNPTGRVPEAVIGAGIASGQAGFERLIPGNNGPVLIEGFSFEDKKQPNGTLGGIGIDTTASQGNVTIRNNIFENDRYGIVNRSLAPFFPQTTSLTIQQNLFSMAGIPGAEALSLQSVGNLNLANNRIIAETGLRVDPPLSPGQQQAGITLTPSSTGSFTIQENLFLAFATGRAIFNEGPIFSVSGAANNFLIASNVTNVTIT